MVADILKHGGVEDSDAMETVTGIYLGAFLTSLVLLCCYVLILAHQLQQKV